MERREGGGGVGERGCCYDTVGLTYTYECGARGGSVVARVMQHIFRLLLFGAEEEAHLGQQGGHFYRGIADAAVRTNSNRKKRRHSLRITNMRHGYSTGLPGSFNYHLGKNTDAARTD